MSDRDKVTEMLRNYRSYKYAVKNGIAPFVEDDTLGMPMLLDFGSRPPKGFGGRGTTYQSEQEWRIYSRTVKMIDGAVDDVLDDNEREVIRFKYLERNVMTLERIAEKTHISERTIKTYHKRALTKLTLALKFVEPPEIHNLDLVVSN